MEADELLKIVSELGVVLVAAASRPPNEDPVKKAIQDGVIGIPFALHLSLHAIEPYSAPGKPDPGWFIDPNQAAGGAFIDHAIYDVAAARWYFEDEVTRVSGIVKNVNHPDWKVEDYGLAILEFSNGGIATIESTFLGHYQTRAHKTILGTEGRIEWIDDQLYVFTKDPKKEIHKKINILEGQNPVFSDTFLSFGIPEPPFTWHYAPMVFEFVDCIKSGKAPIQSGEHARTNLEICLGAYLSAAENRDVTLPLEDCPDIVELLNKAYD
jgi:predicted dehydrogenase